MDFSLLKRDAPFILSHLKTKSPGGSVVTDLDCTIIIPSRFAERHLASLGSEIYICGIYAIIMGDRYGVSLINAMIHINPKIISKIKIEEEEYYEFYFEKGSNVIESTTLIKQDTLTYYIFDEITSKCNIPCYLNYDDLGNIFDSAEYHAGTKITNNVEVTEIIVAMTARYSLDKTIYYREIIKNANTILTQHPSFVPTSDVLYGVNSTLNKISGSYMNDGLISSLVVPTTRVSHLEELLRS